MIYDRHTRGMIPTLSQEVEERKNTIQTKKRHHDDHADDYTPKLPELCEISARRIISASTNFLTTCVNIG
jgi:hypothetical protein